MAAKNKGLFHNETESFEYLYLQIQFSNLKLPKAVILLQKNLNFEVTEYKVAIYALTEFRHNPTGR